LITSGKKSQNIRENLNQKLGEPEAKTGGKLRLIRFQI